MSQEKSVVTKNAAILIGVQIISKIIGVVFAVAVARKLGVNDFGILAFALSLAYLLRILPSFGFTNFITRDVAREKERLNDYFSNILVIKFLFTLLAFGILWLYLQYQDYPVVKFQVVIWIFFFIAADSFIEFFIAFFRAHQVMEYEGLIRVTGFSLQALVGILLVYAGFRLNYVAAGQFLTYFCIALWAFWMFVRHMGKIQFQVNIQLARRIFKTVLPFAFIQLFVMIYEKIDMVMLSQMVGDYSTGLYNSAQRLCSILDFVPSAVAAAFLPFMSSAHKEKPEEIVTAFERMAKYLFLMILPVSITFAAEPVFFLKLIFGGDYTGAAPVMRILSVKVVFGYLNFSLVTTMMSIGQERKIARVVMLGSVVNVVLNLLLIPGLQQNGAGLATLTSEVLTFILNIVLIQKTLNVLPAISDLFRISFFTASMAVIYYLLSFTGNPLIPVLLGNSLYLFSLFTFRVIGRQEIDFIRTEIKKYF